MCMYVHACMGTYVICQLTGLVLLTAACRCHLLVAATLSAVCVDSFHLVVAVTSHWCLYTDVS